MQAVTFTVSDLPTRTRSSCLPETFQHQESAPSSEVLRPHLNEGQKLQSCETGSMEEKHSKRRGDSGHTKSISAALQLLLPPQVDFDS